jgi:hypothetical protein
MNDLRKSMMVDWVMEKKGKHFGIAGRAMLEVKFPKNTKVL